jgi:hypothetical protein
MAVWPPARGTVMPSNAVANRRLNSPATTIR